MSESYAVLLGEKLCLENEIAELEAADRRLATAIGELAHDGRRLTDALERLGGGAADIDGRRRALQQNRAMSETELMDIKARLAKARDRLAEVTAELALRDTL